MHPPAVRFWWDEEADNTLAPRTAAEITGMRHAPLGGEAISFAFDRDEDIVERLTEIETWRWPTTLPSRTFGQGLARLSFEPGHPDDLHVLRDALTVRDGWIMQECTGDTRSLAQLWPDWIYRPSGLNATTIRADRLAGHGYLLWPPVNTTTHLKAPDASSMIDLLDTIETWRRDRRPRWVEQPQLRH